MAGLQLFKSSFKGDLARPNRFEVIITFDPLYSEIQATIDIAEAYSDSLKKDFKTIDTKDVKTEKYDITTKVLRTINKSAEAETNLEEFKKTAGSIKIKLDEKLRYRCEVAQLPGRTFETVEQKTYGPIEKYPNLTTYTDIDLTFILDDDMKTKYYFDEWLNAVNSNKTNNFRYKSSYVTDIQIYQYTVTNEGSYGVNLIDAYPISMNQLDLDWSSDGYHKLTVTFAYTRWETI